MTYCLPDRPTNSKFSSRQLFTFRVSDPVKSLKSNNCCPTWDTDFENTKNPEDLFELVNGKILNHFEIQKKFVSDLGT